jgi:hypothetical protein
MCKTKQHKKQKHGQNHVYVNVEKESVQQLSENMQLRLKRPSLNSNTTQQDETGNKI